MKILGGDWPAGKPAVLKKDLSLKIKGLMLFRGALSSDLIPLDHIESADPVTQENKTSISAKVGWGVAGAVALGPLGLLAGVIGGGNRTSMVLAIKLKDGRKVLLQGSAKEMQPLIGAAYTNSD